MDNHQIPFLYNPHDSVYDIINDEHKEYLWGLRLANVEDTWRCIPEEQLSGLRVAIIDSGICAGHEDLLGRVDVGYNFADHSALTTDDFGHGTRIAGIIGAVKNNGKGIAGIASGVRLVPLKVTDHLGRAKPDAVLEALQWCMNHEIDVINLSMGYSLGTIDLLSGKTALRQDRDLKFIRQVAAKIPIVCAVGNHPGEAMNFPAHIPEVIDVAGYGISGSPLAVYASPKNSRCSSSTLYAPGEHIYTTDYNHSYVYDSGSSIACAFVTGAVAFMKAALHTATPLDIHQALLASATRIQDRGVTLHLLHIDRAVKSFMR